MEILIPISLGELYDRITILRLKEGRMSNEEKEKNVQKELALLISIAEKYPINSHYYHELFNINSHLWAVEDIFFPFPEDYRRKIIQKILIMLISDPYLRLISLFISDRLSLTI
jgi:hypothetical protein